MWGGVIIEKNGLVYRGENMSKNMQNDILTNEDKFNNYKTQMGRLKRALKSQFYLEALFIEYAIIEDRTEAILRYENNSIKTKEGQFVSLDRKLNKILDITREKKSLPNKYIKSEIIIEIKEWKEDRNRLIHALMKKQITTDEMISIVNRGEQLTKELNNMATSYRRAVERKNNK